jgi:hypothetical protein
MELLQAKFGRHGTLCWHDVVWFCDFVFVD